MKRLAMLLIFGLLSVASVQAQFAKPLKNKNDSHRVISLGATGSYTVNDMVYSAVTKSTSRLVYAPSFGLVAECNTMGLLSVGVEVSYVTRGGSKAFSKELLTSYSSTTFTRVNYDILLNGIELRIPVTLYFGNGKHLKPYFYVAPRFSVWMDGEVRWERTYDDASFPPQLFDSELTDAMIRPFDISAMAGVGLCGRMKLGRRLFFCKLDLGYGISVMSTFSQGEVNEEVVFQGWGNIDHEELGKRRLQNAEIRLTFLVPLQKPVDDACDFNQKPYRPNKP